MLFRSAEPVLPFIRELEAKVAKLTKAVVTGDVTVREAVPEDFVSGKTDWSFSVTGGAWNDIIDTTIDEGKFVAIYGVVCLDATQTAHLLKIKVGGADKRLIPLAVAYDGSDKGRAIYFGPDEAIIIQERSKLTISVYADSGASAVNLQILAKVGEQMGKTIHKSYYGEASTTVA